MSREQRRSDRKQQARGSSAAAPPSRRTPVKVAGGSRFPSLPLAIAGGALLIIGLIAYLIWQSNQGSSASLTGSEKAAADRSSSIPGTYVEDQGRGHYPGGLSGSTVKPFCDGVAQSDLAKERSGKPYAPLGTTPIAGTPTPAGTPPPGLTATPTDVPHGPTLTPTKNPAELTASAGSPAANATPTIPTDCHLSNPPSSGEHLNVQRNIDIGGGNIINIPADPDVYPDDIELPRESIPHLEEHAGVFVGWNCADGDTACTDVIQKLKDLVNDRIDNHDNRVVMARDADLPFGTIGVASWTRVLNLPYADYDSKKGEIQDFIATNSCRFDPEGFCR